MSGRASSVQSKKSYDARASLRSKKSSGHERNSVRSAPHGSVYQIYGSGSDDEDIGRKSGAHNLPPPNSRSMCFSCAPCGGTK